MGDHEPAGDEWAMRYWLARVLHDTRRNNGVSVRRVARHIPGKKPGEPLDPSALARFEKGGGYWPDRPEETVIAYAQECGIADARVLWDQAAERLKQEGVPPRLAPPPNPQTFALELGDRAERERRQKANPRSAGESRSEPTSKAPRRKAQ